MGRRGRAGGGAHLPGEERREARRLPPPPSDLDQGADEAADHAAQEAVAHEAQRELVVILLPGGVEEGSHARAVGAAGEREGGEVVAADQEGGGRAHRVESERAAELPGERGAERIDDAGADDPVPVLPGGGRVAGVETGRGGSGGEEPHARGAGAVAAVDEGALPPGAPAAASSAGTRASSSAPATGAPSASHSRIAWASRG